LVVAGALRRPMSTLTDQASVKEYIAQYKLEDELSYAVNLAIKQNSDDPYLVIAEYMKTLSTTEVDDDDDDDVIAEEDEQQIPVMQKRVRHKQVIAKAIEIPDDWKAPVFEKTAAQSEFLVDAMAKNKLFKNLAPSDRTQLMAALKTDVKFVKGDTIIKQGAEGDLFYIVEDGECDISVEGVGSVMQAKKGLTFGELALLHNAPRAATVTALGDVTCFTLDTMSFKAILMGKSKKDAGDYLQFLKDVPVLKALDESSMKEMAAALKERMYQPDEKIVYEGDEGSEFFLVRDGEVKCTKVGAKDEVSKRLKRGDYFGELALLKNEARAATVTAVVSTNVLCIGRATFERILGKLADLQEAAKAY